MFFRRIGALLALSFAPLIALASPVAAQPVSTWYMLTSNSSNVGTLLERRYYDSLGSYDDLQQGALFFEQRVVARGPATIVTMRYPGAMRLEFRIWNDVLYSESALGLQRRDAFIAPSTRAGYHTITAYGPTPDGRLFQESFYFAGEPPTHCTKYLDRFNRLISSLCRSGPDEYRIVRVRRPF